MADSPATWGGETHSRSTAPAPADAPAWWDVLTRFRAAAAEFDRRASELQAVATFARARPSLRAEFDALAARTEGLRQRVTSIGAQVQAALDWLRAVGMGSLGALPLAPLLAIGGIGAVAYFASQVTDAARDISLFLLRVREAQRLEAAGVAPDRAAQLASEAATAARGQTNWLPLLVALAIAGAGAWWFFSKQGSRG